MDHITTGNLKTDLFLSSVAFSLAALGSNHAIDTWLQRLAWTGAIVVSIATLAKIIFVDFKRRKK